jgi:ribosome-binding protein aMBF1 (putative translation factor)
MTPRQLRTALRNLDLSQRALARKIKVDVRTVTRWAAGDAPVPESVAQLLDCWHQLRRQES